MKRWLPLGFVFALALCSGRLGAWAAEKQHDCCRSDKRAERAEPSCCPDAAASPRPRAPETAAPPLPVPGAGRSPLEAALAQAAPLSVLAAFLIQAPARAPPLRAVVESA